MGLAWWLRGVCGGGGGGGSQDPVLMMLDMSPGEAMKVPLQTAHLSPTYTWHYWPSHPIPPR